MIIIIIITIKKIDYNKLNIIVTGRKSKGN